MIKPISDHLVIEPVKEEKKKGGILLPETAEKERSEKGKVIAVGPGRLDEAGKRVPMEVKKGDTVIFGKYGPREIKIKEKEYLIIRQDDVLAVID